MSDAPIAVVGLVGGFPYGPAAVERIERSEVVVGSRRHLGLVAVPPAAAVVELAGPLGQVLDAIGDRCAAGASVCVLASGDPGFFGIVRALVARFGSDALEIHPAPSSVALAFAAVGRPWDDATVVSAHGRPLADAAAVAGRAPVAAVLASPDNPPEAIGKALVARGASHRSVAVVTRIGEPGAELVRTDLPGLAAGTFDPMSVVLLLDGEPGVDATLTWGRPEAEFAHRDGMITKSEVRAVALAKLALPRAGVLWDVGAGSGSVAVECARLAPGLEVVAIERDPEQGERIRANADAHGVAIRVVVGDAPEALADLPDPDRAFVGGGGIEVLDAVLGRVAPGGGVVATFALVDRAVAAHARLGNLVQLSVARGVPLAGGVRLDAQNPVFVCWGPGRGPLREPGGSARE